jgi:hypothetical protein
MNKITIIIIFTLALIVIILKFKYSNSENYSIIKYDEFNFNKNKNNNDKNYNEYYNEYVHIKDDEFYKKFYKKIIMTNILNNNLIENPTQKKNNILFVTFDNRENIEYINIHNKNIQIYVDKWNYEYKYVTKCYQSTSVYWCKMYLVLESLKTNKYDYVIWLDSDTVIKKLDFDIGNLLNYYTSDIFVGSDNIQTYDLINAGVFIIKNSHTGIKFIEDCISYVPDLCFVNNGNLRGQWAASCYEQGVMNMLITDLYLKNTTLLPNSIIFNYNSCSDDVFIMHLYASSNENRVACFV